ncbi:hypothetical protein RHS02_00421, partial [Rhizoctonia solani]
MYTRIIYLSALISLVAAHGTIVAVKGANGITGAGMGIDPSTPRDGTRAKPFQVPLTFLLLPALSLTLARLPHRSKTLASSATKRSSPERSALAVAPLRRVPSIWLPRWKVRIHPLVLPFDSRILTHAPVHTAAASNGIPSATASGEIQMTLHQVNQDGAGPYTCDISADGGNTFQAAKVTKNVPGAFLGLSTATAEDFPLNVQMPSGMQCAGGPNGDACVVRCRNATPAGPFGSCAVVTNAQPAGGAGAASAKSTTGKKQTRALAGPDAFADEDAKDAELEAKLISGINKRFVEMEKKRVVRSRVVGGLSGYWI